MPAPSRTRSICLAPWQQPEDFLVMMGAANGPGIERILHDHLPLFQVAPGSRVNHHAWAGGYWDHIGECLNFATAHYALWSAIRPLPYELWEALEVLFVHDLEKPWKYVPGATCPIPVPDLQKKVTRAEFRLDLLEHYKLDFTPEQQNALEYCEGESTNYRADGRQMGPLAHLCHTCDETSARQFPEYPLVSDDPWCGARRIAQSG